MNSDLHFVAQISLSVRYVREIYGNFSQPGRQPARSFELQVRPASAATGENIETKLWFI